MAGFRVSPPAGVNNCPWASMPSLARNDTSVGVIRRAAGKAAPTLVCKDIELAPVSGTVTVAGRPVELTAQELRFLNYFMHRQGRVISQVELLNHLYPVDVERDPNTIEVYVARLRRKLGRESIKTLRGLGYRFG